MTPTERDLQTINALEEENEELRLLYSDAEVLLADAEEKLINLRAKLKGMEKKPHGLNWWHCEQTHRWTARWAEEDIKGLLPFGAFVKRVDWSYLGKVYVAGTTVFQEYYTRPDSARRGCERALRRFAKKVSALANGEAGVG